MKVSVLACLALSLAAPALALPPPTMNEALVATSAGFVGFTTNGIVFSPDGETFQRTALVDGTTPFAALPVPDGAVAASSSGYLYHTDARGDLTRPAWENQGTTIEGFAGDGRGAVALLMYHRAYVWAGGREWGEVVVDDAGRFWRIAHGLGRYWISGEVERDDESSTATIWSSTDGRSWERVALPPVPTTADGSTPQRFVHLAAAPGLVIASDPFGRAAVSRDGRSWKWTTLPRHPLADDIRFFSDGSRIVREARKDHQLVESLMTVNGETWAARPKTSPWFAERAIPGRPEKFFQVMHKEGDQPAIVSEAVHREPARFVAERDARRVEAERIAQEKARAEAEAKALAARQAAEKKAREEKATAEAKAAAERAARDRQLAPALAAFEKFEAAVVAANSPEEIGRPAAEFVKALDAHGDKPLADAADAALRHVLFHLGGARGYHAYLMELPDARLAAGMSVLQRQGTPAQREMVRSLATQDQNRVFGRPVTPVDTRAWPAGQRGERGPKQNDELDLATIRRGVLGGTRGALIDLSYAYGEGWGASRDALLAIVWGDIAELLIPGMQGADDARLDQLALEHGSGVEEWRRARKLLDAASTDQPAIQAHLERAAQRGVTGARRELAALSAPAQPASAASWLGAAGKAEAARAQAEADRLRQPAAATAVALSDAQAAELTQAIERFNAQSFHGIEDYAEWGEVLAEFVTALDALPNRPLADAVFSAARDFAASVGGADGAQRFHRKVPAARQKDAVATYGEPLRRFVLGGGTPPADWKTRPRDAGKFAFRAEILDLPTVSAGLARGRHGAALDLSEIYYGSGEGAIGEFWESVAVSLMPAYDPFGQEEAKNLAAAAAAGSANALWKQASALGAQRRNDDPEVVALLRRAAELGHKVAAVSLQARPGATAGKPAAPPPPTAPPAAAAATGKATPATKSAAAPAPAAAVERVEAKVVRSEAGGIQFLRLESSSGWPVSFSADLHFADGFYAAGGNGSVYFSKDGLQWETSKIEIPARLPNETYQVLHLRHDGRAWVAVVHGAKPDVFVSTDRRAWKPGGAWEVGRVDTHVAVREGHLWAIKSALGQKTYLRGRAEDREKRQIREWDGQVQDLLSDNPRVVTQLGNRLFLFAADGRLLSTDNGEYWEQLGRLVGFEADAAYYAEGHASAVAVKTAGGLLASARAEVWVQIGQESWRRVEVPFAHVTGLAYGFGRFVAIGISAPGTDERDFALYESVDGLAWERVAKLPSVSDKLIVGPGGFLVTYIRSFKDESQMLLYRPPGATETKPRVRPPTPIPPVRFREFARQEERTGEAGRRRGARALTREEQEVRDLAPVVARAEQGDAAAKRTVAFALLENRLTLSNPWRAELWFKEAMAAGDPQAGRGYGQLLLKWKPETPMAEVIAHFQHSAARGDEAAKSWLERRRTYDTHLARAEAGDPGAIMHVAPLLLAGDVAPDTGSLELTGLSIPNQVVRGERLLRIAAEKGHVPAMMLLVTRHEAELAAKRPGAVAPEVYRSWLETAGAAGERDAWRRLADHFSRGTNGLPKDEAKAYAAGLKLAEAGDAAGMVFVADALLAGRGVAKDEAAARTWIAKAAELGEERAKAWLTQQSAIGDRAARRGAPDGRASGLSTEVLAALRSIENSAGETFDDRRLKALFDGIWHDATYAVEEEDLAQEIAAAARPIVVTAADGQTLTFTKTLPANGAAAFGQILPVGFNPANLQYYAALWPRTANAGLLVAATRLGPAQRTAILQELVKTFLAMASQPAEQRTQAVTAYFTQLDASFAAASTTVQPEFRQLVNEAAQLANQRSKAAGNEVVIPYLRPPWP